MREAIAEIQRAQRDNNRRIAALRPAGGLGRAVQYALAQGQRAAVTLTHVDTGALRASHRMQMEGGLRGRIFIDPAALNPRSGVHTAVYGPQEHGRGGSHAFYERVVNEHGRSIATAAGRGMAQELQ